MKQNRGNSGLLVAGILVLALAACAAAPEAATAQSGAPLPVRPGAADELDAAIRETSDYLNKQLPKGNKLVILNVQSEFPALSEYIIDELIANTVNDRVFSVVDRQQLNTLRAELYFQMSDEVDDNTAQALGRMAGAQIIISGAISRIGDLYRLRVRALSVESAQIAGQFNRNIPEGPTVAALAKSKATGYGDSPAVAAPRAPAAPAASGQAASAKTPAAPAPAPEPPEPPKPTTYKVGDRGPAGGWVFYDKGSVSNGWRYLEAAPSDIGPAQWGLSDTDVGQTGVGLGDGKTNTQRIITRLDGTGEINRAAYLCKLLNIGGFNDWFLPSKGELSWMYVNLKNNGIGGLGNGWYWTSSQSSSYSSMVWQQKFSDGTQTTDSKRDNISVRAVRQF
jgi:hypothetical protein